MTNKIIVGVAACLLATIAQTAHTDDVFENACQPPKIVLAHINGVTTTKREAEKQLKDFIKPLVLDRYQSLGFDQSAKLEFTLLYNYSQVVLDFFETFDQKMQQNPELAKRIELAWASRDASGATESIWSKIWNKFVSVFTSLKDIVQSLATVILDVIGKAFNALTILFTDGNRLDENYKDHEAILKKYADNNYKIILSSHSQGTLFANHYYDYLQKLGYSDNTVKMVYVAPAAFSLKGPDRAYMLANWDLVIGSLRAVGGGDLGSNVDIGQPIGRPPGINKETDWLGHGLLEIYLNENLKTANTKDIYQQYATNAITALIDSSNKLADSRSFGFIRANMDVNHELVKLFVIAPDGTRVANFVRDDDAKAFAGIDPNYVYLYGTEGDSWMRDFISSCYVDVTPNSPMANKFLQTGVYQIGVENTYPSTVNLELYAWDRPFTTDKKYTPIAQKTYTFPRSSNAANSAVVFFNVTVARDDKGKYTYSVAPVSAIPQPIDNIPPANYTPPGGFAFVAIPPVIDLAPPDETGGGGGTPPSGGGGTNNSPTITTQQPDSVTVAAGQTATFTVAANGSEPLSYQWQVSTDSGTTWTNIAGAASATYTTPPVTAAMNGYLHRVVVTNSAGSVTSNSATLRVNAAAPLAIVTQPVDLIAVWEGKTASFTVVATGSGTLSYQWQVSADAGATWSNIAGGTSATYTTPITTLAMDGYVYRVVVSDSTGSITSNSATLSVNAVVLDIVIIARPVDVTVVTGQTASFTVVATGSEPLSYQWQMSTDAGATWANIATATSRTYTTATTLAMNGYLYRVVVSNKTGSTTSVSATLSVNVVSDIVIITQPANITVAAGQTASFTVLAVGSGALSYQWQVSTNTGTTWTNIAGGTGPTYTTAAMTTAMNGYLYRVVITSSAGSATSSSAILSTPSVLNVPSKIAAGWEHTCLLKTDSTVACWGWNDNGQLGDGTEEDRSTPVVVPGLSGVSSISAGNSHTCALKIDGTVVCWGANYYGQLGGDTAEKRPTPVAVSGLSGVSSVAAGWDYTCALKIDGTVVCWGWNNYGQLGDGTTMDRRIPMAVSGLSNVSSIAANWQHACARKTDGTVACWGSNSEGQLGDGTTTRRLTPVTVSGLSDVSSIAAGELHTCAVKVNGTVVCWGFNSYGQLGDGTTTTERLTPVTVFGLSGVSSIATDSIYTCAVKTDGTVACWGNNDYGQLGDGTTTINRRAPVAVSGLIGVSSVATGNTHTCALKTDGTVACWGNNSYGQLGDGTTEDRRTPVLVRFPP